MPKSHDKPIRTVEHIVYFSIGGISMCKTSFKVTVFYDGTRTAKEVLNDAIAAKVRRRLMLILSIVLSTKSLFTKK